MEPGIDKYRLLLEHLPDAFAYHQIVTDSKGKPVDCTFLDVNPAFERMTGLPRNKVIGRKVTEVLPGIENSEFDWISTYGRVALDGEATIFEQYSEPLNRWYEVTAYSDEPRHFAVLFRDITDCKNLEEKLKESEKKYTEVFSLVTGILESPEEITIFALDRECRYLTFNTNHQKTMKQIWNVDIETGKSMLGYIADPVDREKAKTNFHRALNGEAFTIIEEYGDTTFDRRWYENIYNPLYDSQGNVIGLTLFLTDITRRKQTEEALQQSEERYRLLIENANEAIIVAQDGFHVFCNPKALEFFARTEEELKSVPFLDFIHPEDKQIVMESYNKRVSGEKKTEKYVFRIIDSYNNVKWAEFKGTAITWNNRNASLGLITDITNRKETEQKLHDYTMVLEQKGVELEELYQKLDQELDKARAIHERNLPKEIPGIEGLSMHAYYQPAQRMGGDFYNAIQADNKLILYISDVSGHGLEGTLLSAFAKEAIDSYITLKPEELEPEKILFHLNRQYLRENYPDDYFVCIFLMVLDLNSMELTYTGAGFQELPLVHMGDGKKMRLYTEGLPISSAIPEEIMNFTTGTIILSPGTTILINTDGITEQQAGEEQYNGRLEQVFYEHSHLPPDTMMSAIKKDFCRFNGGSMQGDDDITLCIIQVHPEGTKK